MEPKEKEPPAQRKIRIIPIFKINRVRKFDENKGNVQLVFKFRLFSLALGVFVFLVTYFLYRTLIIDSRVFYGCIFISLIIIFLPIIYYMYFSEHKRKFKLDLQSINEIEHLKSINNKFLIISVVTLSLTIIVIIISTVLDEFITTQDIPFFINSVIFIPTGISFYLYAKLSSFMSSKTTSNKLFDIFSHSDGLAVPYGGKISTDFQKISNIRNRFNLSRFPQKISFWALVLLGLTELLFFLSPIEETEIYVYPIVVYSYITFSVYLFSFFLISPYFIEHYSSYFLMYIHNGLKFHKKSITLKDKEGTSYTGEMLFTLYEIKELLIDYLILSLKLATNKVVSNEAHVRNHVMKLSTPELFKKFPSVLNLHSNPMEVMKEFQIQLESKSPFSFSNILSIISLLLPLITPLFGL